MQVKHQQFERVCRIAKSAQTAAPIPSAMPARIDYSTLIATLLAEQAASPTAIAHTHHQVARSIDSNTEQAIVTLLQGRPGWRAAAAVLNGSFHPGIAPLIVANVL